MFSFLNYKIKNKLYYNSYVKIKYIILTGLFIIQIILTLIKSNNFIIYNKQNDNKNSRDKSNNSDNNIAKSKSKYISNIFEKCYKSSFDPHLKIIHLIITRFIVEFWKADNFTKRIYNEDYILNGIRVMKKYLFPSLENQLCQEFVWILMIGDKANKTYVESLFNFKIKFKYEIINKKFIKSYAKNISKGYDALITTRIDYDDRIYYDAVNDVRKVVNIYKPLLLYGYNRGVYYYEIDGQYYEFYRNYRNEGVMSVFVSLIVILNKVNDTYIVYDIGRHPIIRKSLLQSYKSFGIKELNYEPAIFDSGEPKFVWVRQNYSGLFILYNKMRKYLKPCNFNLTKFYGK